MLHATRVSCLTFAVAALGSAAPAQQADLEFELVPAVGTTTFGGLLYPGGFGLVPCELVGTQGLHIVMQPGPYPFASLAFTGGILQTSAPLHGTLVDFTQPGSQVIGTIDIVNLSLAVTSVLAPVTFHDYSNQNGTSTVLSGQMQLAVNGHPPATIDLTGTTGAGHFNGSILLLGNILQLYAEGGMGIPFTAPWGAGGNVTLSAVYWAEYPLIQSYCAGDGSGAACPCGNESSAGAGRGCLNSNGVGALLGTTGSPSLGADSLVLVGSDLPAGASSLFFQGTSQSGGGSGVVFGDGLRCASGTLVRLGTKTAAGGTASYPGAGDPHVSAKGMVQTAASTRFYQAWYRNAGAFCTPSTFNLTNALSVTWVY